MHLRDQVIKMRQKGATHYEIASVLDLTPAEVFSWLRPYDIKQAKKLAEQGLSERAIAKEMQVSRGLVRKWVKMDLIDVYPNSGGRPKKEEETSWVKIGTTKYGPHDLPL